jgi:hypothetical protein
MNTVAVNVKRVDPRFNSTPGTTPGRAELEADLARVRTLATWLDSQFEVAGIKFGFDAIIGLIPGIGDTVTSLIALYPLWIAKRHNLGKALQMRMALNVAIDFLPGLIPVVGDVIDVMYKANLKNLKLLERAAELKMQEGR